MKRVVIYGLLSAVAAVVAIGLFLPPLLTRASNCGGNSPALSVCKSCIEELEIAEEDKPQKFDVFSISQSDKSEIARMAQNHWIPESKFFIRTNVDLSSTPKRIIVVCDTQYGNVPQPTVWNGWRENPAHAVGYSDGTAGLISPEEFKTLDLSGFIDATKLPANNVALADKVGHL
ncbi:MAG: hypothetical protein JWQ04_2167 [Pedosphaera sp.]|nr:hypothetical protein [Pedosphaera sp.]